MEACEAGGGKIGGVGAVYYGVRGGAAGRGGFGNWEGLKMGLREGCGNGRTGGVLLLVVVLLGDSEAGFG